MEVDRGKSDTSAHSEPVWLRTSRSGRSKLVIIDKPILIGVKQLESLIDLLFVLVREPGS